MTADEQFEELASRVVQEASAIDCGLEDYIAGLDTIIGELKMAKVAAQEDVKRRKG